MSRKRKVDKAKRQARRRAMARRRAVASMLGVLTLCFIVVMTVKFVSANVEDVDMSDVLENYDQIEVTICSGDRAWNIQSELTPDEDIREMLYYASILNDKKMGSIMPGETLIFLTEREVK